MKLEKDGVIKIITDENLAKAMIQVGWKEKQEKSEPKEETVKDRIR